MSWSYTTQGYIWRSRELSRCQMMSWDRMMSHPSNLFVIAGWIIFATHLEIAGSIIMATWCADRGMSTLVDYVFLSRGRVIVTLFEIPIFNDRNNSWDRNDAGSRHLLRSRERFLFLLLTCSCPQVNFKFFLAFFYRGFKGISYSSCSTWLSYFLGCWTPAYSLGTNANKIKLDIVPYKTKLSWEIGRYPIVVTQLSWSQLMWPTLWPRVNCARVRHWCLWIFGGWQWA